MSEPHRGEVWWGEMEAFGRRPFLILSRDEVIPWINAVITAPITRTIRGIPSELPLDRADGMPESCVATFDNVSVLTKSALRSRICTLGPARMREACAALRIAVDC